MTRHARRLAAAVLLLAAGVATGVATVLLHARWWGLLLGVLATAATMLALPRGWWSRPPFGLGWAAVVAYAVFPRPEGDFLIANGVSGYLLLVVAVVVATWAVVGAPTTAGPARAET